MNFYTKSTGLGLVTVIEEKGFITSLLFGKYKLSKKNADKMPYSKNILSDEIAQTFIELEEYLNGERKEFSLPLNPAGTSFQQKVWSAILKIPYGETRTYKEIAETVGVEKAYRAVGSACHENKIPIIIPCHRVLPLDGQVGKYLYGKDLKEKLLKLEVHGLF